MAVYIIGGTSQALQDVDATAKSARVSLYDVAGNILSPKDKSLLAVNQGYMPISGLDGGTNIRAMRVGEYGTLRVTSEVLMFHDGMETTNVNAWWNQTTGSSFTIAQTTGVLTLNNSGLTTATGYAVAVLARQFPKYARQPLYARFKANIIANPAAGSNHTLLEFGFGVAATNTAIVPTGCFFRWKTDGTLAGIITYNGVEQATQLLAQGVINIANYYNYDITVDDDFVRFSVQDSAGNIVAEQSAFITISSPYMWSVSHLPVFARVYCDGTGGGTVNKLNISAVTVQILDATNNKPWADQLSGCGRAWLQLPTTQAQSATFSSSAPGGGTPSNSATVYTTLGGDYIATMTAASENTLSLFGFTITAPYTFYIKSVYASVPFVSTVFNIASTPPYLIPFLAVNASTVNLSTATGIKYIPLGNMWTAGIAAAVGTIMTGNPVMWTPATPIACLPSTILHFGWKCLNAGAVTTGAIRGVVLIDGFFE